MVAEEMVNWTRLLHTECAWLAAVISYGHSQHRMISILASTHQCHLRCHYGGSLV